MAKQQPEVWPILIGTFSDPRVQPFASMEVAGIGAPVVPLLRQALKNKNPQVRFAAVAALQMRPGAAKEAAPKLAEALKDSNPNFRAPGRRRSGAAESRPLHPRVGHTRARQVEAGCAGGNPGADPGRLQ
jgi:HEAT repeat protein